jgi:hypothetical protein
MEISNKIMMLSMGPKYIQQLMSAMIYAIHASTHYSTSYQIHQRIKRDNPSDWQGIKDIKEGYALSHVYEFLKWPIIIKMSIHKETCTHKKDTKDKNMISRMNPL